MTAYISITASEKDIKIKGSEISAENISLKAKENIEILASQNKNKTDENTKSSGMSIGVTIGAGGLGGIEVGLNKAKGQIKENGQTHMASQINANDKLNIETGKDLDIIASKVSGGKVEINVGENLNIESRQDKQEYDEKNSSAGLTISTDLTQKGKTAISGGINKGKVESDYESVTDQAGIYAGKEGFDIHVGKNTNLKGAVIASQAEKEKNKISTDTLTYEDIENKAEYSADSKGINVNTDKDAKLNEKGITPNIGVKAEDEAGSTTKSAIAEGNIEVRSEKDKDLEGLSRDTQNALNKLGEIFDKTKVEEQQELANLFGELAFKKIGDLGLKEGSLEKIALDSLVGGIMSKLGGGSLTSGAAGAGINQLIMNELKNIKDPALLQWASAMVGGIAAKLTGGNAQTGASTAASETKNNWLGHEQTYFANQLAQALDEKDVEQIRDIIAKYYALSNYNAQHELTGEGDDERITESLYPMLDCLVSQENKSWLDGGLNYTLDKIVNQDPEMYEIANQYRSELERKNEKETINWQYVYNDNLKQWRINPETGEPHPDDLEEYYKDQAEKQSLSDNLAGKIGMGLGLSSTIKEVLENKLPKIGGSVAEGSSKATTVLRNELSQSKSSQVWGELSNGTNQGIKHFADYWELYPERIPSIAGRLGVDPSKFAKTAEGFKNFTDEALRITKTEGVQIKEIGDKKIYFMNGAENAKKGVVVIMKEGKLQSMMPSELRSFLKMQ